MALAARMREGKRAKGRERGERDGGRETEDGTDGGKVSELRVMMHRPKI
jgi:hypothetical protein